MPSLCVLLPVTSKGHASTDKVLRCLSRLAAGFDKSDSDRTDGDMLQYPSPQVMVCLGVDEDDPLAGWAAELRRCFPAHTAVAVRLFSAAELAVHRQRCGGAAPLCWMWDELAKHAQQAFQPQPDWLLLLGDDTRVEPAGWPELLTEHAAAHPHLRCIALLDAADPGFPSFPAIASTHLQLFGRMLPPEFGGANQGADPFLYELYRSYGAAGICPAISVHNAVGGMQGSAFPAPHGADSLQPAPRYARCPLAVPEWRQLLASWRDQLQQKLPQASRRMQVAVAVPTFRVDTAASERILERCTCSDSDVDIRVLVQVDNPAVPLDVLGWLCKQQASRLDGMRVRINTTNQGAAAARNQLLDEAAGCDCVVLFDDDVVPAQHCLDAYVAAFKAHPDAAGFAGPTYLPRCPAELLPTAIHMSDVSFFWEAPAKLGAAVPWAVTANMAVRGTDARFREGFPKTGGGEDVDFCVQLGARLVAVPGAAAEHPWWPEGRPKVYMRFWRWAEGDGRLIALWPRLAYWRAPNPPELCLLLLVLGGILLPFRLLSAAQLAASMMAVLLTDLLLTVLRNCCLRERRQQHPCTPSWLRPLAAAEAFVVATLYSETGRLVGHLKRRSWGSICRSFDWFCGSQPAVVAGERRRAAVRAAACLLAVMLVLRVA